MSSPGPRLGVSAVVVDDECLLLVRRARPPAAGSWAVPGGRVQHGETLAEAVTRELREETGIEGLCGPLLGVVELTGEETDGEHLVVLAYDVTLLERVEPVAADDAQVARWVPVGDVADLDLSPGLAELLHDHAIIPTIT